MKTITLTRGYVATVDDGDFEALARFRWRAHVTHGGVYAVRSVGGRAVLMHRTIVAGASEVDHINGDGLDNRRANLRPASRAENSRNRRRGRDNTTGYKGVSFDRRTGRYRAHIYSGNRQRWLGYHDTAVEAAAAYDHHARLMFGPFARTNNATT